MQMLSQRSARYIAFVFFALALATTASAQTTYTWNQPAGGAWNVAANWTPTRTTPATNDVLVFNTGGAMTVTAVQTQTIGQLSVSGNTTVTLQSAAAVTVSIAGGAGADLSVGSGSQLNFGATAAANAITMAIATGATGTVNGSMAFTGVTSTAHRLTSADAGGLTFQSGAVFTEGSGTGGGPFGATSGTVIFASGSTYVFIGGATPFPASVFQTGSLFSAQGSATPSFSGRTYANFELKTASTITVTGGSAVSIDNLTITQGTLNFNMTGTPGHAIKGNISVALGATLNFNPLTAGTVNLNGTAAQSITNAGTLNLSSANQTINVANANGITLNSNVTFSAGTLSLSSGTVTTNANTLSIASAATVTRTSGYVIGNLKKTFAAAVGKVMEVGTANGYSPVTANVTAGTFPADLTAAAIQSAQPDVTAAPSIQRYWTLTANNITSADLTLQYLAGDVVGNEAIYQVIRVSGGVATYFPSSSVNATTHTATLAGVTAFSDWTVGEPNAPPSVTSVSVPSNGTYVAGQNLDFTVFFSKNVLVTTTGGTPRIPITFDAPGVVYAAYLSGSGTNALLFRYTVASGDQDPNGIALAATFDTNGGTIKDSIGNDAITTLNGVGSTAGILVDAVAPLVTSITRASANPTSAASVDFTVTFSEAVTGVDIGDFTLTTTGLTGTSVTGVSGGPTVYTVTASTGSGVTGTMRLDVNSGASIADLAGNSLAAGFTGGDTYTIDRNAPGVSSVTRADANPTNAASVHYTVTFTQDVTGVDTSDFALTTTGVTGASVTGVSPVNASTYTVTVNTGSGDGTIRLDVLNDGTIRSTTNVPLSAPFTSGQVYTIDRTQPTVQSIGFVNPSPTNAASVQYTVTFSESVTGVSTSTFALDAVGVSGAAITNVTGSGTTYTVTVNTGTGDGTIELDAVADASVHDPAGNAFTTFFASGNYVVDKTAPAVTAINRADTNPSGAGLVHFTVTFSESVSGVDAADFALATTGVASASITNVAGSGSTYTVTVDSGSGDGTIGLNLIDDDSIADSAGNKLGGTGTGNGNFTGQIYTIQKPPLAPTGLVATAGSGHVALTWTAAAGASTYNVKRATVHLGPYTTIASSIATTSYDDTTAVNGTTYFYVVSGSNTVGEGPNSNEASATPSVPASASGVVISQIYGGGGNSGATLKNDYIELFNRGSSTVDLTGWTVQYQSATGTSGVTASTSTTLSGSIAPGHYFLVQEAAGAAGTVNLPTPDVTGTIAMGATVGKVALVNNTTLLTGSGCPLPPSVADFIGYGTGASGANCFEGAASAPTLTNTTAALRAGSGCTDSNNNASDFASGTPNPRNSSTPAIVCGNSAPIITAPANPITTVNQDAPPFTVSLSGSDDGGVYVWSATPGTGISNVAVTGGQSTNSVTYTVTLQAGFNGTATFTAALSDGVNTPATQTVNIRVSVPGANNPPTITPPANPITSVGVDAAPFTVSLTGADDGGIYNWSATPGLGVSTVSVTNGQGTTTATFTVTLQSGFSGTASFTASLSDNVNPPVTQAVNINVVPPPNHITISQLYGGGGNTGATYKNDYIQLHNPTSTAVDVTGWSLQYTSSTGSAWTNIQPLGGTIGPNEYYLVALGSGGAVGADLPAANITGSLNMSATTGKVALVRTGTALSGVCPIPNANVVDFVGYGTGANCSEGNLNAPAPSNTTAIFRKNNGNTDSDNNGNDFTVGAPNPIRTTPIAELGPWVSSTDPIPNDTNVPHDGGITVNFSEAVNVDPGWYNIACASTGLHNDATVAHTNDFKEYVITPNTNFQFGESCTVTINRNSVHDQDLDDSAPGTDTLANDSVWSFLVVAAGAAAPYPPSVHLTMGNPSNAVTDVSLPNNYLMEKPTYALSYNRDKGTPNWVSWHLEPAWFGSLARVDTFRADPAVPPTWYRVQAFDFSFSGFDRGHMTPNADRDNQNRIPINQETYLMSNMVPQSPDNNQGPWANFENYLRSIVTPPNNNELYIVSGPLGVGGTGSNGFMTSVANGHVVVPSSTWKVVLLLPIGDNDVSRVTASTRTIAIQIPNVQGIHDVDFHSYFTTVRNIEDQTGFNFFSNVPQLIQNSIENGTDGTNPPAVADESASTNEDTAGSITLQAVSPTSNTFTYTIVTPPAHGTLSGSGANRTYTPLPDFNGTDTFTFQANDGTANTNTATVTVSVLEVNDPPIPVADSKSATRDVPLTFPTSDLTANDAKGPTNENGQILTVTAVTPGANTHGTVSLSGGQITYQSDATYTGPASFTYTVCDNGVTAGVTDVQCATGTVNVNVSAPTVVCSVTATNNGPICSGNSAQLFASTSTPGVTFSWTGPNGFASSQQNPAGITQPGTYTVTITRSECSSSASTVVSANTSPTATITATTMNVCPGSVTIPVTLTGTAPWTLTWSDGFTQSNIQTAQASRTMNMSSSTTLSITSVSDSSCSGPSSARVVINVSQPVAILQQPETQTVTRGSTATFTVRASGSNIRYQWFSIVNGEVVLIGDSATLTTAPLTTSTIFWVRVSNECSVVESVHVEAAVVGGRRRAVHH
jgi:DNA/RNA endonuclease G (NUC1)